MPMFHMKDREVHLKIVYYGPGLCGKTANLEHIYNRTVPESRGRMISLKTETERTLFFDFMPLSLGSVRDLKVRLHMYTTPGQVFFNATRQLILRGVDGIVFVADSQAARLEANMESLESLKENLAVDGRVLDDIPMVIQLNKRDTPDALPFDELAMALATPGCPVMPACARAGTGVFETLKTLTRLVMNRLVRKP